jgi:glutamyl-tRNA(Gln) amidotransferase subunit D
MPKRKIIDLFMDKFKVSYGDKVKILLDDGREIHGIIMPKHMLSKNEILIIKLPSGYNVGLDINKIEKLEKIEDDNSSKDIYLVEREQNRGLPKVVVLGVGGTILSRVDYRTGAVRSAVTAEELLEILPEVIDIANIETKIIMNKYSEHLTPRDWEKIAEEAYNNIIREDVSGVVILHGTDTLGYTSAALSFALRNLSKPVILVGSQRSSDRPSSDAALNLISAILAAAQSPFAYVLVAMHDSPSDDRVALHRGTRIRKNHTSRRDAFQSIDTEPIAYVEHGKALKIMLDEYRTRDHNRTTSLMKFFNEKVALLKFYPSMNKKLIDILVLDNYDAIILEGTGLGHIGESLFDAIRTAIRDGVHVFMTSQCIWGRVNLNVYDTGRELLKIGVVPLENMIAETALVKAMWALGNFAKDELPSIMLSEFEGELTPISPISSKRGY